MDKVFDNLSKYSDIELECESYTPVNGSDERHYCSPGFDLPVGQLARTPYLEYDGYHNSLDDKEFMGIKSLVNSARTIEKTLKAFEHSTYFINMEPYGEPMLGKRNLYPGTGLSTPDMMESEDSQEEKLFLDNVRWLLAYCDGEDTVADIASRAQKSILEIIPALDILVNNDLIKRKDETN